MDRQETLYTTTTTNEERERERESDRGVTERVHVIVSGADHITTAPDHVTHNVLVLNQALPEYCIMNCCSYKPLYH